MSRGIIIGLLITLTFFVHQIGVQVGAIPPTDPRTLAVLDVPAGFIKAISAEVEEGQAERAESERMRLADFNKPDCAPRVFDPADLDELTAIRGGDPNRPLPPCHD